MARTNRPPWPLSPTTDAVRPPTSAMTKTARNDSGRQSKAWLSGAVFEIVAEFYDAAVSGADPIQDRPGFAQLLDRIHATRLTSPHPLKIFLKIEE